MWVLSQTQMGVNNPSCPLFKPDKNETQQALISVRATSFQSSETHLTHGSRLEYTNTRITYPDYINYFYLIEPQIC